MNAKRPVVFVMLRGLFYACCFVMFWIWVAVSIEPIDSMIPLEIPASIRLAGWPIAIAGAVLTAWCIGLFIVEGRGTPAPFDPPTEFVSQGPYRHTRNPMYIGALSIIMGCGFVVGSPSIVALAFIFGLLAHVFVLIYEEPALQKEFGESYSKYLSSVNRWIPGSAGNTGTSA